MVEAIPELHKKEFLKALEKAEAFSEDNAVSLEDIQGSRWKYMGGIGRAKKTGKVKEVYNYYLTSKPPKKENERKIYEKLQKANAISKETAKSPKEIGLSEAERFELEVNVYRWPRRWKSVDIIEKYWIQR